MEVHLRHEQGQRYRRDEHAGASAYRALLCAAEDRPHEVSELCLEIVGRRELSESVRKRVDAYEAELQRKSEEDAVRQTPEQNRQFREFAKGLSFLPPQGEMNPPFPDGPSRRIDDEFRTACLESGVILPLLHSHPEAAKEVFLAACIKSPYRKDPWNSSDLINDLDITGRIQFREPMWFQGPFIRMLRDKPNEAVDIIIRLVGFATTRWEQWDSKPYTQYVDENDVKSKQRRFSMLYPDGEREWLGDARVYGWYRNRFGDAPLIVCALMALERYLYEQMDAKVDVAPIVNQILSGADSVAFVGVLLAVGRYQALTKKSAALFRKELLPLLSIWQVYEWDSRVVIDTEMSRLWRMCLMNWTGDGERVFNIVKEWHSMPHRSVDLTHLCQNLMLSYKEVRNWYEKVSVKWRNEYEGNQNESLELLRARFEISNYHMKKVEEGVAITFEWPEHIRDRTEKVLAASQLTAEGISFPIECRKLINQSNPPSDFDAEKFWDRFLGLVERTIQASQPDERCASIICGGIAVLVCHKIEWLENNPERFEWCIDQLTDIVANPPGYGELPVAQSITETFWDVFFSECAIHLLARNRNDECYRFWACHGLCAFHYEATGFGMATAWRRRNVLGEDFYGLLNVVYAWAVTRYLMNMADRWKQSNERYRRWLHRAVAAFVADDFTAKNLTLARASKFGSRVSERLRVRAHRQRRGEDHTDQPRRRFLRDPGLDVTVIQKALSPMHELEPRPSTMRSWQVRTFEEAIGITFRMLGEPEGDSESQDEGIPYEYDTWAMRQMVLVLVQMTEDENPQRLWEPILSIRSTAFHWLESFASAWVFDGLMACKDLHYWTRQWRAMVEFASSSPNWGRSQRGASRLDDAWMELLGMGLGGRQLRERLDLAPVISSMLPLYEKWAQNWLDNPKCAHDFSNFIINPAACNILMHGVRWLLECVQEWSDWDWKSYHLDERMTALAHHIWLNHRAELERDDSSRALFFDLLNVVTSHQHQPALQLLDEVQRHMRTDHR